MKSPFNDATAIFAHQEFYGVKIGAIVSENGDKWNKDYPLIISGHIHDYDRPQDNIIYVGTPCQHSFGDRADKTISLFSWDNPKSIPTEERIDLGLIKKMLVNLTCNEVFDLDPKKYGEKQIKLKISGTSDEIKAVMKLKKVKQWQSGDQKIKIVYQTNVGIA